MQLFSCAVNFNFGNERPTCGGEAELNVTSGSGSVCFVYAVNGEGIVIGNVAGDSIAPGFAVIGNVDFDGSGGRNACGQSRGAVLEYVFCEILLFAKVNDDPVATFIVGILSVEANPFFCGEACIVFGKDTVGEGFAAFVGIGNGSFGVIAGSALTEENAVSFSPIT